MGQPAMELALSTKLQIAGYMRIDTYRSTSLSSLSAYRPISLRNSPLLSHSTQVYSTPSPGWNISSNRRRKSPGDVSQSWVTCKDLI